LRNGKCLTVTNNTGITSTRTRKGAKKWASEAYDGGASVVYFVPTKDYADAALPHGGD
jgi:hypothetical protein